MAKATSSESTSLTKTSTSLHDGGNPVRSKVALRIKRCREMGFESSRPLVLKRSTINRSISVSSLPAIEGGLCWRIGRKAQCRSYLAPLSIHFLSELISSTDNRFPVFGGGITSSGSSEPIRFNKADQSLSPVSESSRRSALRAALSGPWHSKQFSARIGKMSQSNCTFEFFPFSACRKIQGAKMTLKKNKQRNIFKVSGIIVRPNQTCGHPTSRWRLASGLRWMKSRKR